MILLGERGRCHPAHLDNVSLGCMDDPAAVCVVSVGLWVAGTLDGPLCLEQSHRATSWPCEGTKQQRISMSVLSDFLMVVVPMTRLVFPWQHLVLNTTAPAGLCGEATLSLVSVTG